MSTVICLPTLETYLHTFTPDFTPEKVGSGEAGGTATNQQPLPNTKFGQASEVITRYIGIQGVPRRFTQLNIDNESADSLHSCPPSSPTSCLRTCVNLWGAMGVL